MSVRRAIGWRASGVAVATVLLAATAGCAADDGVELGAAAAADGVAVRSVSVGEGERIAAGYLVVDGGGFADRLVGASSPASSSVSLHRTGASGAMVATEAIEIPAGEEVRFVPGGDHLMLEGLAAPLMPGEVVTLALEFERSGVLQVEAPVIALVDVLDAYDGGW